MYNLLYVNYVCRVLNLYIKINVLIYILEVFFVFFFWSVKIESLYLIIVGEIWDQILSVIEDIIPLAIVVIVVFCILSNQRAREQCRSMLTSIIDKIKGNNSRQRRDPEGRRDSEHSVRLHVDETQHSDNSSGE